MLLSLKALCHETFHALFTFSLSSKRSLLPGRYAQTFSSEELFFTRFHHCLLPVQFTGPSNWPSTSSWILRLAGSQPGELGCSLKPSGSGKSYRTYCFSNNLTHIVHYSVVIQCKHLIHTRRLRDVHFLLSHELAFPFFMWPEAAATTKISQILRSLIR